MIVNIIKALKLVLTGKVSSPVRPALLMLPLLMLTACPSPDPSCVDADDWGDKSKISFSVPANEPYTSAKGIIVENGQNISVTINGDHIDICPDGSSFSYMPKENYDRNGKLVSIANPIRPDIYKWQAASYTVPGQKDPKYLEVVEGSKISINVLGAYTDREGEQREGRGLYVYIGDKAPVEGDPSKSYLAGNWWYGQQYATSGIVSDENKDNRKTGKNAKYPEFFELWDNGSLSDGMGGFSGFAPKSGKVWFKYARTASARGLDNVGERQSSPWLGRYEYDGAACGACTPPAIMGICSPLLAIPIFNVYLYPACIAATTAACAGSGHLPEADNLATDSGRYCREFWSGGDHWVDNAYDGSEWDRQGGRNPNGIQGSPPKDAVNGKQDGYTINITNGCDGTYGQYMDMNIGSSQVYLTDKTNPEGCIVGEDPQCEVVKGEFGETIRVPHYTVQTTSSPVNMDMRKIIDGRPNSNPGFVGVGRYQGKLASSGELWFHIKDDVSTPGHPGTGFYGDNIGSYKVTVETKNVGTPLSDIFNGLVNPVRGIIFGYCKVSDGMDPKLKYQIAESDCGSYVDAKGVTHPAWQSGITRMMYDKLVNVTVDDKGNITTNAFLSAIRAGLVLYIIIYGGAFMMGMVEDKQEDFLKRIIRFGIVVTLLSASSWNFFNNYLFSLFTHGVDNLIGMMTIEFSPTDSSVMIDPVTGEKVVNGSAAAGTSNNIFAFADMTASKFINLDVLRKIFGLIFASPLGIIYVLLILMGLVLFIFSLVKALVLYLLALIAVSLLLIVAPIFLSLMLFDHTRPFFDGWIKNVMNYTLQPVFVFAALSIFNIFMYTAIYSMLHYRVCWDTVYSLAIAPPGMPGIPDLPLFRFYMPSGGLPAETMPVQLFMVLIFIIVAHLMYTFIDWMAEMAAHLTTEMRTTSLAGYAARAVANVGGVGGKVTSIAKGAAMKGVSMVKDAAMNSAKNAAKNSVNKITRK